MWEWLGIFLSFCFPLPGTGKKEKIRKGTTQSSAKAKSTPMMSIRIFSETLGVQNITKQSCQGKKGRKQGIIRKRCKGVKCDRYYMVPEELGKWTCPTGGLAHGSSSATALLSSYLTQVRPWPIHHTCPTGSLAGGPRWEAGIWAHSHTNVESLHRLLDNSVQGEHVY